MGRVNSGSQLQTARIGRVAVSKLADKSGRSGGSFPFMHRTLAAFQLNIPDIRSTPALFDRTLLYGCCNPLVPLCLSASLPLCLSAAPPVPVPPPHVLPGCLYIHSLLCYTFTLLPFSHHKTPFALLNDDSHE
jgi:hypothetical protein